LLFLTLAPAHKLSSIVLPVGVSFAVEGHLTKMRLIIGLFVSFGTVVAKNFITKIPLAKPINDARFVDIVGGHFQFHPVADGQANKAFAHLSGNVCENEMFVRELNAKHCACENGNDFSFQLDRFPGIHDARPGEPALKSTSAGSARSDYLPPLPGEWTWTLFACASLVHVQCSPADFLAVERAHGGVGFGRIGHRDEGETARLSSHAIHHQRHFANFAVFFEKILKIVFGGLKGEISYI
jgi:hypothetical protein